MGQADVVKLAQAGNPQAIEVLINRSLEAQAMSARITGNNDCLVIQVEAATAPEQQSVVPFIKNGLRKLNPGGITRVIVRGRVAGQTLALWQDAFKLEPDSPEIAVSPTYKDTSSQPAPLQRTTTNYISITTPTANFGESILAFLKTRNGERVALVLGTACLTTLFWLGPGGDANRSTTIASNAGTERTAASAANASGYSIKGSMRLVDSDLGGSAGYCYGTGGYSDIEAGMPVTIRDGQGTILATGKTGSGSQPSDSAYSSVICEFSFQVDNVPKADFYAIEVGRRGQLNYSFAEMQAKNWTVSLSLGT